MTRRTKVYTFGFELITRRSLVRIQPPLLKSAQTGAFFVLRGVPYGSSLGKARCALRGGPTAKAREARPRSLVRLLFRSPMPHHAFCHRMKVFDHDKLDLQIDSQYYACHISCSDIRL